MADQKYLEWSSPPFDPNSSFTGWLNRVYRQKIFLSPDPDQRRPELLAGTHYIRGGGHWSGVGLFGPGPGSLPGADQAIVGSADRRYPRFPLLFGLLFSSRFGLKAQALTVLSVTFSIGVVIIWQVGFMSGGPIWLFSFSVVTGVLLGLRAALAAALLNGAVIILLAWLSLSRENRSSGNF